jgi:hypothetical protein
MSVFANCVSVGLPIAKPVGLLEDDVKLGDDHMQTRFHLQAKVSITTPQLHNSPATTDEVTT